MAEVYDIGDRPVLAATFRDEGDVLTVMSAIVWKILDPAGTVTTAAIGDSVAVSPGVYEWQIPAAFHLPGRWVLRAAGIAPIETAAELVVQVRVSAF